MGLDQSGAKGRREILNPQPGISSTSNDVGYFPSRAKAMATAHLRRVPAVCSLQSRRTKNRSSPLFRSQPPCKLHVAYPLPFFWFFVPAHAEENKE